MDRALLTVADAPRPSRPSRRCAPARLLLAVLLLLAGCHASRGSEEPEQVREDVEPAAMDGLSWSMSVAEARRALEAQRLHVRVDGPREIGKDITTMNTELRVAGLRWYGSVSFTDAVMDRIGINWDKQRSPDEAVRIVQKLERRFGVGTLRETFHQVWRARACEFALDLADMSDGWTWSESWSSITRPSGAAGSDDPRFHDRDGWNGFPWGTRHEAMARAMEGTGMGLGAWGGPACTGAPDPCADQEHKVGLRDGDRIGTATFRGGRLASVLVAGVERLDEGPHARLAAYAKRFGPPSEDRREIQRSFEDGMTRAYVQIAARLSEGTWRVELDLTPVTAHAT